MAASTFPPPLLEIIIYQVGNVFSRYVQNDPQQVAAILQTIQQPHRFFDQPFHQIQGEHSFAVYRSNQIVRVNFLMDNAPDLPFLGGATAVREVTQDIFERRFDAEEYAKLRADVWNSPARPQIGFVHLEAPNMSPIIWEVLMMSQAMSDYDVMPFINNLLKSGGLWAHRIDRGLMLINPSNISCVTFLPGPPITPGSAWQAKRLEG